MYMIPQNKPQNDILWTSNTPSYLNFAANILILGLTYIIIRQNYRIIQLNEQKVSDEVTTNNILKRIEEKL